VKLVLLIFNPMNKTVEELPNGMVDGVVGLLQLGNTRPTPRDILYLDPLHLVVKVHHTIIEVSDIVLERP
jgi:hypothetical protein